MPDEPSVNSEQDSQYKTRGFIRVATIAATYGLWLVTTVLGGVDVLILRGFLLKGAHLLEFNPWAYASIDKWGLVLFGVGWLILTFAAEAGYQKAAARGFPKLLRYFAVITGIQVLFGGLVFLLTRIM